MGRRLAAPALESASRQRPRLRRLPHLHQPAPAKVNERRHDLHVRQVCAGQDGQPTEQAGREECVERGAGHRGGWRRWRGAAAGNGGRWRGLRQGMACWCGAANAQGRR